MGRTLTCLLPTPATNTFASTTRASSRPMAFVAFTPVRHIRTRISVCERSRNRRGNHQLTSRFPYTCGIDAEPLHRYKKGGYHPVHLGDQFKRGRYRVLHKLGWGGYSTVWAARDQDLGRYVAVKISTSDRQSESEDRQLQVMRAMEASSLKHPGASSVMKMLDHFEFDGPNGTHKCFVLELLGPSIADVLDVRFSDNRLPAGLAKNIARQTLLGLDYLHQHGIGHGDLHTRNIVFTLPLLDSNSEDDLSRILGKPEVGQVRSVNGEPAQSGIPDYIVRPSSYPSTIRSLPDVIRIVDYGESFFDTDPPVTLHTPLAVRAPEVVLGDTFDHRVDLWTMGCLLFELFTGQPPFDVLMLTPGTLIGQMEEFASDRLPERWIERANRLKGPTVESSPGDEEEDAPCAYTLQQWLEEVYFDESKKAELSPEDASELVKLVASMLWFEPSSRKTASNMLNNTWLR